MPAERLQKIIAAAGIASRRKAEQIITTGLVSVNGQVVTELGTKADPDVDHIRVNGKLLHGPERHVYLLMNKPKGYVTTLHDPEHRPTVMDLLHGVGARVYPVGRLDYASEGLLLLTNDGEFANLLMKAASHVPKAYMVKVAGQPKDDGLSKLRSGLFIGTEEGRRVKTAPARVNLIREANNPWYEVTLIEGKNRQIRRMFEEIGHHVEKIKRVRYGNLELDVHPGKYRKLTTEEVDRLKAMTKPGANPARFIPIFTKPKVTYAKAGAELAQPKFIPRPAPQRPSTFSKPNKSFSKPFEKRGDEPARPKFTPRPDSRPSISAKPAGSFARSASRSAKPSFGRGPSAARPSDPTRSNGSFGQTSKPRRPEFSPRASGERPPKFVKPNAFAKYGKKPSASTFTPRSGGRESAPKRPSRSFVREGERPAFNPRASSGGRPLDGRPSNRRPSAPGKPSGSFLKTAKPDRPKFSPRSPGERSPAGRPPSGRPFNPRSSSQRSNSQRPTTGRPASRGGPRRTDQRRSPRSSS
jgi:23S rRNA pseudouridine2605 synthase